MAKQPRLVLVPGKRKPSPRLRTEAVPVLTDSYQWLLTHALSLEFIPQNWTHSEMLNEPYTSACPLYDLLMRLYTIYVINRYSQLRGRDNINNDLLWSCLTYVTTDHAFRDQASRQLGLSRHTVKQLKTAMLQPLVPYVDRTAGLWLLTTLLSMESSRGFVFRRPDFIGIGHFRPCLGVYEAKLADAHQAYAAAVHDGADSAARVPLPPLGLCAALDAHPGLVLGEDQLAKYRKHANRIVQSEDLPGYVEHHRARVDPPEYVCCACALQPGWVAPDDSP